MVGDGKPSGSARRAASHAEEPLVSTPTPDDSYARLARQLPDAPSRARAEARLRAHPHFAVLRDQLETGDTLPVPASALGVLVETPDGPLLLPPGDAVQLPIIARYGGFQRDDLARVLSFLEARGALRGDVFVDVGANIGAHTLQAMRSGFFRRALAIEPAPTNARLLTLNMRLNRLDTSVDVRPCALGRADGTATLVMNPLNCGDARLAPITRTSALGAVPDPSRDTGEEDFARVDVAMRTFDGVLADSGLDVAALGLVWMDAQGSEGHIVAPSRVLRECPVPLYIELWPHGLRALDAYAPLKAFVESACQAVVHFESGTPRVYAPSDLDTLYQRYERDEQFTDLLLLR